MSGGDKKQDPCTFYAESTLHQLCEVQPQVCVKWAALCETMVNRERKGWASLEAGSRAWDTEDGYHSEVGGATRTGSYWVGLHLDDLALPLLAGGGDDARSLELPPPPSPGPHGV